MPLLIVAAEWVNHAYEHGADMLGESCVEECTPDQLKMMLSRGERTLVQMVKDDKVVGWGVYKIDQLPNLKVLHITNLVAHNGGFEQFFDEIKGIAKAYACTRVRASCKPAQARLYRIKCGFKPLYETI